MKAIQPKVVPVLWKRNGGKDIVLNVSFKDALIRFGLTIFIPIVVLLIDVHLVIYTAPVIAYLFLTALIRFCVIKYWWHHYALNERTPVIKPYGTDPDYPEETI
jgi:hypothetical protein